MVTDCTNGLLAELLEAIQFDNVDNCIKSLFNIIIFMRYELLHFQLLRLKK